MDMDAVLDERPGRLAKQMTMVLHTTHAQHLLTGQKKSTTSPGYAGVMTFANACFRLWMLTDNDNPHADFALIEVVEQLDQIQADIDDEAARLAKMLAERQSKGIIHAVAESDKPLAIDGISFGSPYGYLACELLGSMDYLFRLLMTLQDVGLLKTVESRKLNHGYSHRYRSLMARFVKRANFLTSETLRPLCRSDFGDDVSNDGKLRAVLAIEVAGEVPAAVLAGERRPDHYKSMRPIRAAAQAVSVRVG